MTTKTFNIHNYIDIQWNNKNSILTIDEVPYGLIDKEFVNFMHTMCGRPHDKDYMNSYHTLIKAIEDKGFTLAEVFNQLNHFYEDNDRDFVFDQFTMAVSDVTNLNIEGLRFVAYGKD